MKKFYQVATVRNEYNEWIHYESEDLEKAKDVYNYEIRHSDKGNTVEIREYELEDNEIWDELDDERKCIVLSVYNVIEETTL